jgi:hypothetical protein
MPEDNLIKDLALKFAEKNPSLLRDIMESHWIRFEELEFSQGRQTKGKAVKNYKEIKK